MIAPDRLKPFLVHEDYYLRNAAAEFFGDCWSRDGDLIPLVLQACRRYGDADNLKSVSFARQLRLSQAGLTQLLEHLPRVADASAISFWNDALAHAPPELTAAPEPALATAANVSPDIAGRWQRRRELAARPSEELWREFLRFAEQARDESDAEAVDWDYADDLTDLLGERDVPDGASLVRQLRESRDDDGWLPFLLVDLAGNRRLAEAVPALVDLLPDDSDFAESAVNAPAKINDAEAARLIRERYPKWSWDARCSAADALGRLKHPEAEDAVLALLPQERDLELKTWLGLALCKLFSERGIEVVRGLIRSGYDRSLTRLEEDLLPVADIFGVPLPEADQWRKARERSEREFRERMAEMERESAEMPPAEESAAGPSQAWDEPQRPFVHTEERVGRNDPCPCGSGKKFKKCCGKR